MAVCHILALAVYLVGYVLLLIHAVPDGPLAGAGYSLITLAVVLEFVLALVGWLRARRER